MSISTELWKKWEGRTVGKFPLRQWLGESGAVTQFEKLREPGGMLADYLNLPAVTSLIEQHQAGRIDATDRIWRLLNLQIWGDVYITGNREQWQDGLMAVSSAI